MIAHTSALMANFNLLFIDTSPYKFLNKFLRYNYGCERTDLLTDILHAVPLKELAV
jgi:hypothetical protein